MNNLEDINLLDERDKTEILNNLKNTKINVDFETSDTRELPESGENIVTIVSKIVKYLTDLKEISFTGDFSDLSNQPEIKSIKSIEFTESSIGSVAGEAGATDTYTISYTDDTADTFNVYNGVDGESAEITIDTELSEISLNPIQNSTITNKINEILSDFSAQVSSITTALSEKASNTVFKPSGVNAAIGLVPKPDTTPGTSKYLREDGNWVVPPTNTGQKGDTGAAAGFGTPTFSTTTDSTGVPSCTVTASGSDTEKIFNFAFKNIKGDKGDTGEKGDPGSKGDPGAAAGFGTITAKVNDTSSTPSCTVTTSGSDTAKNFTFTFDGIKGKDGTNGTNGTNGLNGKDGAAAGFGTPTVSVGTGTGTPTCSITTSGSDTAKVFNFKFDGLKGAPGTNGTNATTTAVATESANGLMSAAQVKKLNTIDNYVPLAGTTMDVNAKLIFPTDNSKMVGIMQGCFDFVAGLGNWDSALRARVNANTSTIACVIGAKGVKDTLSFIYIGGDSNNPIIKIDPSTNIVTAPYLKSSKEGTLVASQTTTSSDVNVTISDMMNWSLLSIHIKHGQLSQGVYQQHDQFTINPKILQTVPFDRYYMSGTTTTNYYTITYVNATTIKVKATPTPTNSSYPTTITVYGIM